MKISLLFYFGVFKMELTIEFECCGCDCPGKYQIQVETVQIRRGQRKEVKCGYCGEKVLTIQGNRKETQTYMGKDPYRKRV